MKYIINVNVSNRFKNFGKFLNMADKAIYDVLYSTSKANAAIMIKNFHDGIKERTLSLYKLSDGTIQRKKSMGAVAPKTPLYFSGDAKKKNSYMNMLRMKRLKNGYSVYPSIAKHWKANMTLRALLKIHEYGCYIKKGKSIIRIPPRPAFYKSYQKTLKSAKMKNNSKDTKKAIQRYLLSSKKEYIQKQEKSMEASFNRAVQKFVLEV